VAEILHKNLALLRVTEPSVVEEIRAVLPLEEYLLGQLSPTELVVDPLKLKGLLELLEARGMAALVKRSA